MASLFCYFLIVVREAGGPLPVVAESTENANSEDRTNSLVFPLKIVEVLSLGC